MSTLVFNYYCICLHKFICNVNMIFDYMFIIFRSELPKPTFSHEEIDESAISEKMRSNVTHSCVLLKPRGVTRNPRVQFSQPRNPSQWVFLNSFNSFIKLSLNFSSFSYTTIKVWILSFRIFLRFELRLLKWMFCLMFTPVFNYYCIAFASTSLFAMQILKSLTSEVIPSATQFFKRAYKISHFPRL